MQKIKDILTVVVLLTVLVILGFLYFKKENIFSVLLYKGKSSTVLENNDNARNLEAETIRNRPFPLAGFGNDAGMETGDDWENIPLRNRESLLETYPVGTSLTTRHGVKVDTKFMYGGNQITGGYGYSQYNPSPKTNGVYSDVKVTLENLNKTPFGLTMENIVLIDQEKRKYSPLKQTKDCGFEKTEATETDTIHGLLNPNVPCIVNLLFEVATSTNSFHIRFDIP